LSSFGEYTTPLKRAPAGIVILMDEREEKEGRNHDIFDCGRAFQNMKLAATNMGLGSVPQGIDREQAKKFLNLPDTKSVLIALALGHPANPEGTIEGQNKEEVLEEMGRGSLDELIHWEKHS
jgi:nitroreductase